MKWFCELLFVMSSTNRGRFIISMFLYVLIAIIILMLTVN